MPTHFNLMFDSKMLLKSTLFFMNKAIKVGRFFMIIFHTNAK